MSGGISDQVSNLSKRVEALEGADIQDKFSVTRVNKVYGTIRITAKIRVLVKKPIYCSDSIYCGDTTYF